MYKIVPASGQQTSEIREHEESTSDMSRKNYAGKYRVVDRGPEKQNRPMGYSTATLDV